MKDSKYIRNIITTLIPEGWNFFTIPPRDEKTYIYKVIKNNKLLLVNKKLNSYQHFFGIKRKYYTSRFELPNLLVNVTDSQYISFNSLEYIQLPKLSEIKLTNKHKHPTFCGNYIIEKRKLTPWLLFKENSSLRMPSKIIYINVNCEERNKK